MAFQVEGSVKGQAELQVSFTRYCGKVFSRKANFIYFNTTYKIHFSQWKYVLSTSRFCQRFLLRDRHLSIATSYLERNVMLKVVWIPQVFKQHEHFLPNILRKCDKNVSHFSSFLCYNMSLSTSHEYKYFVHLHTRINWSVNTGILVRHFAAYHVEYQCMPSIEVLLLSWQSASNTCSSLEGSLPYFHGRNELEAFLALLSFSDEVPPLEAVFIGLKASRWSQVGSLGFGEVWAHISCTLF